MPNFVINQQAEIHACHVLGSIGIDAERNNTVEKLDPDLVIPSLGQFADEKSTFNYKGIVKFDAISTFQFMSPPHKNKLDAVDFFNNELIPYLYDMSCDVTFTHFLMNIPYISLSKVGSVLSPQVSYGVHHLIKGKREGRSGKKWVFTAEDIAVVFDYQVVRDFLEHNWSYFRVNRKADSGKGDHWESAYFAVPMCHLPSDSIVTTYTISGQSL